MRWIGREEVRARLDPDALLEVLALALRDVSSGAASVPPRIASFAAEGLLGAMTAYVPSLNVLAAKLVSVFARHEPSHQAVIVAFDPATGTPLAAMDGTEITAQRTAAVSALATRLLAREDARVLAIIGTGVQARSHAFHVARVRKFEEILIAGRSLEKAARLAGEIPGARAVSLEEAAQADVICVTTHSQTPVLREVRPGAHINSVGLHPQGSELSAELIDRCSLFVESRKSALAPPPAGAFELQGRTAVELGEILASVSLPLSPLGESPVGQGVGGGEPRSGGNQKEERIGSYISSRYGVTIAQRTAELIWLGLGANPSEEVLTMDVKGTDASGASRTVTVSSDEVRIGRRSSKEITLYKSVGIAAEDAAAASLVLK